MTYIFYKAFNRSNISSGGSRISLRRVANSAVGGGGHQHTILPKFPKNCTKLKEFGPRGASLVPPLRSATDKARVFLHFHCFCHYLGSNTGIGFETARDFAARGARVIMVSRNMQKAEAARSKIIGTSSSNKTCTISFKLIQ